MRTNEDLPAFSDVDSADLAFDLTVPPQFLLGGRFLGDGSWTHRRRTMDCWELIVGIEGLARLTQGGRTFEVGPGDVLFFRPGVEHAGVGPSPQGTSFYWVHFHLRTAPGPRGALIRLPAWLPGLGRAGVRAALVQLQADAEAAPGSPALADYRLGIVLLELQRAWALDPGPEALAGGWFRQLLEWIRVHPGAGLTVKGLAAQAGRHPDHLARVFRERLGVTPLEYLHRRRADEAKHLLAETSLPVKRIAWDLGIGDERQFSRFFRARTGLSPTEYRRSASRVRLNTE